MASVTPAACAYTLTPARQVFNATNAPGAGNPNANQTGSVTVTSATGCTWTAASSADWLTFANASGSSNGALNFSLTPNTTNQAWRATITVGDQSVTIEQGGAGGTCLPVTLTPGQSIDGELSSGDCEMPLPHTSGNFQFADQYVFNGRVGERVQLTLATLDSFFEPQVTLFAPNGEVLLQASAGLRSNVQLRLPSRGVVLLPATRLYRVQLSWHSQAHYALTLDLQAACNFTLATPPPAFIFESAGGTGSLPFQTSANCDWALSSNVPWIMTNTTTARGSGAGTATFAVAPNPDATVRTATLTLGGATITVTQLARTALASAASYATDEFAPDSIVAAFGLNLPAATESARTIPLPTRLANVAVRVRDSANVTRDAPLFFVSPGQVNLLLPAGTTAGRATILIGNGDVLIASSEITIAAVAPGVFTFNADGAGVPAGYVLRVRNGQPSNEPLARFDQTANRWLPAPIDLGPESDEVFLVLFGTGFRNRSTQSAVTASLGGVTAQVLYAGTQGASPDSTKSICGCRVHSAGAVWRIWPAPSKANASTSCQYSFANPFCLVGQVRNLPYTTKYSQAVGQVTNLPYRNPGAI